YRSFERDTAQVKAVGLHPVRCMTLPSRLQKPMPPSVPWPPLANPSGSRCMGLASHHQCTRPCPSHLIRQNPRTALDFIPMTRHRFHGRHAITVPPPICAVDGPAPKKLGRPKTNLVGSIACPEQARFHSGPDR